MKTSIILILILVLFSCSEVPEQETQAPVVKPKLKNDNVLKDYQGQLQKAKDMEKEVLKAAERQKKAIEDATN